MFCVFKSLCKMFLSCKYWNEAWSEYKAQADHVHLQFPENDICEQVTWDSVQNVLPPSEWGGGLVGKCYNGQ